MRRPQRHRVVSPRIYKIVRRNGDYLADADTPCEWTDREPLGLAFLSREAAERFIEKRFVGLVAARQLSGIRVVG